MPDTEPQCTVATLLSYPSWGPGAPSSSAPDLLPFIPDTVWGFLGCRFHMNLGQDLKLQCDWLPGLRLCLDSVWKACLEARELS